MITIEEKLTSLNKAALVSYVMVGDPNLKTSYEIIEALIKSGSDVIELGMPFSDPVADGDAIQKAAKRALKNNISISDCLSLANKLKENYPDIPLILMGYFNPIHKYGTKKFIRDASKSGIDGLIIVDLPYEELINYPEFEASSISIINLITPLTKGDRLKNILKKASSFLYYISVFGITGTQKPNLKSVKKEVLILRKATKKKIAVGFGINSKAQVKELSGFSDLIVIGSAYCKIIEKHQTKKSILLKELKAFNKSLI